MDINRLFKKRKALIDKKLNVLLPKENAAPKKLHKAMRYGVFSGGKRIRPILAIESCLCCGGGISDVIRAACAIELAHAFSLIHDDLPGMDDDDYRRGKLTCHRKYGEAAAILAGDALLSLAFEILADGQRPAMAQRLIKEFAASLGSLGIAGGQCVDIEYEGRKKDLKVLNYINSHKTGALIKAAVKMGALASCASAKKIKKMEEFGTAIGEAFQLVDDVLDNGDSLRALGKTAAIKKAKTLTEKAKGSLGDFGAPACALRGIADYLIERRF